MGCTQPGLHACALPGRLPARKRKKKDRKAEERELSGRGRREPWGRICGQRRGALVRGLRLRLPVSPASRPSALSPTGRAPPAAPAQLSRRPRSVVTVMSAQAFPAETVSTRRLTVTALRGGVARSLPLRHLSEFVH